MAAGAQDVVLVPAARAFVDAAVRRRRPHETGPHLGRAVFDTVQNDQCAIPIVERWVTVATDPGGPLAVRVVTAPGDPCLRPVVMYIHGGGWVFGNAGTHDRLVRELAVRTGAAVVFPEYALSPRAGYPVALEQVYATTRWAATEGRELGLDGSRLAVVGDCVGGNLAIALTLLSRCRADFAVLALAALCPVTDAAFDTESYCMFGEGYALNRDTMRWCWDQYTADPDLRGDITVSPRRATMTDLAGFPPSLIITAEADVVRDEGEAFAAQLRAAGAPTVAVRYDGVIHNFAVLNALKDTLAARAATAQTAALLSNALMAGS